MAFFLFIWGVGILYPSNHYASLMISFRCSKQAELKYWDPLPEDKVWGDASSKEFAVVSRVTEDGTTNMSDKDDNHLP